MKRVSGFSALAHRTKQQQYILYHDDILREFSTFPINPARSDLLEENWCHTDKSLDISLIFQDSIYSLYKVSIYSVEIWT